ncbi:MAG: family 10 glycosylhydrolase [Clostridia bacterium]|nr:family 10 glycosylhydrolase [Clostridia bacterium]
MSMTGVWMWPESLIRAGVEKTVGICAQAGVTDIFLLTKGLNGHTIFPCAETECVLPDRDLLREALDAAHAKGIRVHAWFTSAGDSEYAEAHPERALYHYVSGPHKRIVSITDSDYRRRMRKIIRAMAENYDVDGLHLDYIRYNSIICGWSEDDMANYAAWGADTGKLRRIMNKTFTDDDKDPEYIFNRYRAGDRDVRLLTEARRFNVRSFAHTLADTAREVKPGLTVSAALMPEGAYEDLAFSDLHYGQNYSDMAGILDMALPMSYSHSYGEDENWVAMVARNTLRRGMHTLAGIHAFEGGTAESVMKETEAALKVKGVSGICLFREGAVIPAWADEHEVRVYNPSGEPVTGFILRCGENDVKVEKEIAPYQEAVVSTPEKPTLVRVFSGEKELPVYLCK